MDNNYLLRSPESKLSTQRKSTEFRKEYENELSHYDDYSKPVEGDLNIQTTSYFPNSHKHMKFDSSKSFKNLKSESFKKNSLNLMESNKTVEIKLDRINKERIFLKWISMFVAFAGLVLTLSSIAISFIISVFGSNVYGIGNGRIENNLKSRMLVEIIQEEQKDDLQTFFFFHDSVIERFCGELNNKTLLDELMIDFYNKILRMGKETLYKLRFINSKGIELARMDINNDSYYIHGPETLQNKSTRDYTLDYFNGKCDEYCFGNVSLNREDGKVDVPIKRATRIYRAMECNGTYKNGFIIASFLFSFKSFEIMNMFNDKIVVLMVNDKGKYLKNSFNPELEWQSDYGEEDSFFIDYGDDIFDGIEPLTQHQIFIGNIFYVVESIFTRGEYIYIMVGNSFIETIIKGLWVWIVGFSYDFFIGILFSFIFLIIIIMVSKRSVKISKIIQNCLIENKEKLDQLLKSLVPEEIANRLMRGEGIIVFEKDNVCVMFADIVKFTERSQKMSPNELVFFLKKIFTKIDVIFEKYGCYKIKTIGDAYMGVVGIEMNQENKKNVKFSYPEIMLMCCIEIVNWVDNIRIGINCGKAIFGVIENKSAKFDIWGTTPTIASKLESSGIPQTVSFSEEYYGLIPKFHKNLDIKEVKTIEVKGFKKQIKRYAVKRFLEKVDWNCEL